MVNDHRIRSSLVEQVLDGPPAVLAVVDREHGALVGRNQHSVVNLPVALEVTADGVEHQRVGLDHGRRDLDRVVLVELPVDAIGRVAEAVDRSEAGQLVRAEHERVDRVLLLGEQVHRKPGGDSGGHVDLLSTR